MRVHRRMARYLKLQMLALIPPSFPVIQKPVYYSQPRMQELTQTLPMAPSFLTHRTQARCLTTEHQRPAALIRQSRRTQVRCLRRRMREQKRLAKSHRQEVSWPHPESRQPQSLAPTPSSPLRSQLRLARSSREKKMPSS